VMRMLAVASPFTFASGITSLVKKTRTGEKREIAPLECWLMEVTQVGSGAASRALCPAGVLPPLQEIHSKSAAETSAAAKALRIMEAPKGVWIEADSVQRPMLTTPCGNCGKHAWDSSGFAALSFYLSLLEYQIIVVAVANHIKRVM
jgi:hypothetical protein